MAQVRGQWLELLCRTLRQQGLFAVADQSVPASTKTALARIDPAIWYEEHHELSIYSAIATARGLTTVRNLGRHLGRNALQVAWFDGSGAIDSFRGTDPSRAFGDLPRVWALVRRDAGELRCVEHQVRQATTELRSFRYSAHAPWCEAWLGQHEGLLRHLHHAGHAEREVVAGSEFILRTRTRWAGALSGVPTGGFRTSP
jgi:hypothetical protein